jgi:hypothetical protein
MPRADGTYETTSETFRVARITPTEDADPRLVPEIQGLTDAKRIGDWDPPFPVDLSRITPRDEQYWDRYRAAPKAFINLGEMRRLWDLDSHWVTAVRFNRPGAQVRQVLTAALPPGRVGLSFRPVRKLALDAAEGSTEYSGLFLGLGFFIVAAGVALAATLMQLTVARRSTEWGVQAACGLPASMVARLAHLEGLTIAAIGALAGGLLGVAYAAALVAGLTRWWVGAIGTAPLWLHVEPASVVFGVAIGLAVGYGAVAWAIRGLVKRPTRDLVAGARGGGRVRIAAAPRWKKVLLAALIAMGVVILVPRAFQPGSPEMAFGTAGFCLLLCAMLARDLALSRRLTSRRPTLACIAARNAALDKRHSLLVFGLLACASFTLVAVAPNVQSASAAIASRKDGGAGGYRLMATASVTLPGDLSSPGGRKALGFTAADEAAFAGVEVVPLLMHRGEDASCLNLAKPTSPTILAASPQLIQRGGFAVVTEDGKGWNEMEWGSATPRRPGELVPAFGDSETVTWILHSGLGEPLTFAGGAQPLTVRFKGLVEKSIFAGEVLIPEADFRRLFPTEDSPHMFLIATPPGAEAKVADVLRRNLGDLGLDVRSTSEILSGYLGVQNAYIATFLALGALGLLLGTVGLAAAMAREALERRKEFALMSACGFTRRRIAEMLVMENGGLLALGVLSGAVSALVSTAPLLVDKQSQADWPFVCAVLVSVLAVGLALCAWAARLGTRGNLLAALRSE